MTRSLPPTASVAHGAGGAKLHAPSAARNAAAISDLLAEFAPVNGEALELASGTGQHVVAFALRLPGLKWQPTDVDATRRASIDAYVAESGLNTVAPAAHLDACRAGWSKDHRQKDLIVLVNLLHLISLSETEILISEAAKALKRGGRFVIYGPFLRGGELISEGDASFHASLKAQDPQIGYKDDFDTMDLLQGQGLEMIAVIEMPSNNLALVAEKSAN